MELVLLPWSSQCTCYLVVNNLCAWGVAHTQVARWNNCILGTKTRLLKLLFAQNDRPDLKVNFERSKIVIGSKAPVIRGTKFFVCFLCFIFCLFFCLFGCCFVSVCCNVVCTACWRFFVLLCVVCVFFVFLVTRTCTSSSPSSSSSSSSSPSSP